MTTIYLANKLMSMKLDKVEYEKIKYHKIKILQEKHKCYNSLKNVMNSQEFKKDCRLCLKPGVINLFDETCELNFVESIKNILGIEIDKDDGKPQYICECCEGALKLVSKLKETALATQWRLQQELEIDYDTEVSNKTHKGYFNVNGTKVSRDWTCGKCHSVFFSKEEFNQHELQPSCRTKLRNYICESCSSQFRTLSQLNRHRMIHTGELKHACPCTHTVRAVGARARPQRRPGRSHAHCPATFPSASGLASHRRGHLPARAPLRRMPTRLQVRTGFKASIKLKTPRQTVKKFLIVNHVASQHRTAKPYRCKACDKTFATRKMMHHHERKLHNRPKLRSGVTPIYMRQQENT